MIHETEVSIDVGDGQAMRALLLQPQDSNGLNAGVIAIHDIFGFTPDIRRIGLRLAEAGYPTLVPDLYDNGSRKPLCVIKTLAAHERGKGKPFQMLDAARRFLMAQTGVAKTGMMGFCMGGHFALLYAARAPVDVVAPFYGGVPRNADEISTVCPVVGGWGKTDKVYGHHGERLVRHLDTLGVEHDVKIYPDVGHSYMNNHDSFIFRELGDYSPLRSKYNEAAAEDSWQRVFKFFERVLAA